jgi:nicotinate-nucleotide--dimethylbenzimidazole phosphoribosyltransferase
MSMKTTSAIERVVSEIVPPSDTWLKRARGHLDVLTKPPGSLGLLEDIAAQMVSIREERFASSLQKAVYVFAADHGVTVEGVSAYPREVTRQMVMNFLANGAAISVLAKLHHVDMHVVDVGVDADFEGVAGLIDRKARRGTRNMLHEAAMSEDEMIQALEAGLDLAKEARQNNEDLVAVGEMGIGNTTASSAITSALTHRRVEAVTGKGTGLDSVALKRKSKTVEAALMKHFGEQYIDTTLNPLEVLRCVGGLEIAAMTGFILGAARERIAIVIDGFISTSAAAIAFAIEPMILGYLFAGHQSEEPGHRFLLEYVGLKPILSLNMRLGEGTGAVLAMPVIESAVHLYNEIATFTSSGVSEVNG